MTSASRPANASAEPPPFHPAVSEWFGQALGTPTEPQRRGWPQVQAGHHTLIAAPTGTGKTLAAFMCSIDALVRRGLEGPLADEVSVLYVSPLKALGNDVQKNLEQPLRGISAVLESRGLPAVPIRTLVRTGDTPAKERAQLTKRPPHVLVTTPESLYVLLTSEGGRRVLSTTRSVIVDEIHAVLADKRGAHLALSLERLDALSEHRVTRIGLSATQRPIERVGRFLVGEGRPVRIVDCGHRRHLDLTLELPRSPLDAVMSAEVWAEVYDRIAQLVEENRTTLVFVGNRRLSERLCRQLGERLGEDQVAAHHGSLSKATRLSAESRLKSGSLKALVATASLELGIDIGTVDLVCQLGSTRSIARLLQRVGRSGHHLGAVPRGRLFPLSRNDLVECAALLDSVQRDELEAIDAPLAPLDILAQQLVASVASEHWSEDALFQLVRRSYPYRSLERTDFDAVIEMLGNGFSTQRGRRGALLRRDRIKNEVQGRRAARLTALTGGGAIPDNADYRVVLEPEQTHVGSVHEDFAIEAMAGDIFQLGNASWRILKVETGLVRVADAKGQPPTLPFWLGEAPARSDELSVSVARLREEVMRQLDDLPDENRDLAALVELLTRERDLPRAASEQLVDYLAASHRSLGVLPTQRCLVVERFFDEAQNTHLVIHSSFGARVNRAWGLALRKRFCRAFNFELQAAANEDAIILSLGPTHSFELKLVGSFLRSATVKDVLVQALLDAPMFEIRWRYNTTRSLATPRFQGGRKVPAPLLRIRANDLLATAFPDQQACLENLAGEREIPDNPLVRQTIDDCLHEATDAEGLVRALQAIEGGEIQWAYRDVTEPSPLAHEILNANPYAFLDPAPLEERRTQAVITRRFFDPRTARDLGVLDQRAIERVQAEAWPRPRSPDELCDALCLSAFAVRGEYPAAAHLWFEQLIDEGRATRLLLGSGHEIWVAAERLTLLRTLLPEARTSPELSLPAALETPLDENQAWLETTRGRLESLGPVTSQQLAGALGGTAHAQRRVEAALVALEGEGFAMQGSFTPGVETQQWCERGLLARIHRYTLERLRREIEPVSSAAFLRFLFVWQGVGGEHAKRGRDSLCAALEQLDGFEAAANSWERGILSVRIRDYDPRWLDELCLSGRIRWGRRRSTGGSVAARSMATTPLLVSSPECPAWVGEVEGAQEGLSPLAREIHDLLERSGPSFFRDLQRHARGGPPRESGVEEALSELVAAGRVTADSFAGLRGLLLDRRKRADPRRRRPLAAGGLQGAGRWSLLKWPNEDRPSAEQAGDASVEGWARLLLRRYGVVFRALLDRERVPPWRDLLREYRRLEARGEVRGGRFVERHAGEQFALPEAIPALRRARRPAEQGREICLSACDPLNLLGSLLPGPKVPATPHNCILFRDALPIAVLEGAKRVRLIETNAPVDEQRVAAILRRGPGAVDAPDPERPMQPSAGRSYRSISA